MGRRPRRRPLITAAVGAGIVAASYLGVVSGRAASADERARRLLSRPLGPAADRVVGVATDVGSVYGIAGVSAVLALTGRRRLATDVAGAGLLAWCAAQGAKPALPRDRPYQSDAAARLVAPPAGTSWPSGHAAVSAAMAVTVAARLPRRARPVALVAVLGVGLSRLYVGVHHLSDVVAGCGVGLVSAAAWRAVRSGRRRSH